MRRLNNKYWQNGYDAYFNGVARNKNPFNPDRDENCYELWEDGWDYADSDMDDE